VAVTIAVALVVIVIALVAALAFRLVAHLCGQGDAANVSNRTSPRISHRRSPHQRVDLAVRQGNIDIALPLRTSNLESGGL